jgi:hypothetical protein
MHDFVMAQIQRPTWKQTNHDLQRPAPHHRTRFSPLHHSPLKNLQLILLLIGICLFLFGSRLMHIRCRSDVTLELMLCHASCSYTVWRSIYFSFCIAFLTGSHADTVYVYVYVSCAPRLHVPGRGVHLMCTLLAAVVVSLLVDQA